jgi:tetratricopeptide (TPR) repeat protein
VFRLLGLHPGPDITAAAAASLAGAAAADARQALRELARASLLAEETPGRFSFHDLLRAYAEELAGGQESPDERQAATLRVLDHYLHTSHAASLAVNPHYEQVTLGPPDPGVLPEAIAGDEQAMAWFETEQRVLLRAVSRAAQAGLDTHAWQLPATVATFLDWRGHWDTYLTMQQTALAAALRLGDLKAQAIVHRHLAKAHTLLSSYQDGHAHFTEALTVYRQLGDTAGQGSTLVSLGALAHRQGRYRESLAHTQEALGLFQAIGDRVWQAMVLNNIGWSHAQLGDCEQALVHCRRAQAMFREIGHRHGEANAWDSLGFAHQRLGQHDEAVSCFQLALTMAGELGNRHNQAKTLTNLGDAQHAAGRSRAAREAWQQALVILEDLHHPSAGELRARLRPGQQE